ncbi:MDR family MFS transporter [Catellatospora sp. KI3]|uniref:MDR family MFS transporter n=1 Tax=Catellatospora sp. KI3 TaxID=3041620 RepID=UPI002482B9F9|nr:MDR family MFS transporter [Catellatospora sp. KI3]MDI1465895.1 MDR family MFS transporter [Catellatospora sp. KI3]
MHPAHTPRHLRMGHREILESLSGLLLVLFVAMISSTIVSTALPRIIGELNGTQTQYTWVVTATLLAATATTPIWGRLSDMFGKKLLVMVAIAIFVAGSLLSGFARDTSQLIAFRAVQGIGVGGLQALVQIVIASMIPPRERGRYNGYLGGVMAVATLAGPLLGGLIVDTSWLGWRWCFFVGVPIAALAFALLWFTLDLPRAPRVKTKIDYLGALLITAGVSTLLVWVSFVGDSFAWLSTQSYAMVGGSLAVLALAVWVELRAESPVVPITVIARRVPALAILASLAVGMAMFGGSVFLGQYFQIGRGYSPTEAGLLTMPMMLGVVISSTISGKMVTRSGRIKPYLVTGTIVLVAGFAGLSFIDHTTPLPAIGAGMLLVGLGVGMTMQNLVLAVQNTTERKDLGAATGSVTFFRSLGGTIGVSVLGAVLADRVQSIIAAHLAAAGMPAGSGGGSLNLAALPPAAQAIVREAYGDATGHVFLISAAVALVGVLAALALPTIVLRSTVDVPAAGSSAPNTGSHTEAARAGRPGAVAPAPAPVAHPGFAPRQPGPAGPGPAPRATQAHAYRPAGYTPAHRRGGPAPLAGVHAAGTGFDGSEAGHPRRGGDWQP